MKSVDQEGPVLLINISRFYLHLYFIAGECRGMSKLEKAAQIVINRCLELRKSESILIIADDPYIDLAQLLFEAASKRSKYAHILQISSHHIQAGEVCDAVAKFMQNMNVVIAITSKSLSHIEARRAACHKGARFISMPRITNDTFSRLINTDFDKVSRLSRKLKDILNFAKEAKVTAPNGTFLTIPLTHQKGYADTGLVTEPGAFSNLPAGEACIAPDPGKTEGELIVDCGMGITPQDAERLVIIIKEGRAFRITGGNAARRLSKILTPFGPNVRKIAEFGIGTNDAVRISGYPLEDEKGLGNIHLALGNDLSFGGDNDVPVHLDGVVYKASLLIDGRKILERGRLVLE